MARNRIDWRSNRRNASRHIANIRETIEDIRQLDKFESHAEHAHLILNRLKSKQRNTIIESALTDHLQSEALKPYQAELIKMQAHLENTGQR